MASFEPAVAKTIIREGGSKYTNDPKDPGGPTRFGIAQSYHKNVDVKNLTEPKARLIYKNEYWYPIKGDLISHQGLAEMLFDAAVNLGVGATVNLAQAALEAPRTGVMDDATIAKLNSEPPDAFAAAFTLSKIARYVNICLKRPDSKKYFFGWVKRSLEGVS